MKSIKHAFRFLSIALLLSMGTWQYAAAATHYDAGYASTSIEYTTSGIKFTIKGLRLYNYQGNNSHWYTDVSIGMYINNQSKGTVYLSSLTSDGIGEKSFLYAGEGKEDQYKGSGSFPKITSTVEYGGLTTKAYFTNQKNEQSVSGSGNGGGSSKWCTADLVFEIYTHSAVTAKLSGTWRDYSDGVNSNESVSWQFDIPRHTCNSDGRDLTYLANGANCLAPALYYMTCTICGGQQSGTFSSGTTGNHNWTNTGDKICSSATCTSNAFYYRQCTVCLSYSTSTWEDSGTVLGHHFATQDSDNTYLKTEATCTQNAVYYYKCSRCTEKTTSSTWTKSGSALGHDFATYVYQNDATCLNAGTKKASCSHGCGTTDTQNDADHPALGHDFADDDTAHTFCQRCEHTFFYYSRKFEKEFSSSTFLGPNDASLSILSHTFTDENGVVELNGRLETLTNQAFNQDAQLQSVILPTTLTEIGEYVFYQTSIQDINLPSGLTKIGNGAFGYCKLQSVSLPNSVTSLGISAFEGCEKVSQVTLSTGLTSIPEKAFYYTKIREITIPSGVRLIEGQAFSLCPLLDITIPATVDSIGIQAFNISGLTANQVCRVTCYATPNPPKLVNDVVFSENYAKILYVPSEAIAAYKSSFWGNIFTKIRCISHTPTYNSATDATCVADGNLEYWHCDFCDVYYDTNECTNEVALADVTLPALGHDIVHVNIPATCNRDGVDYDKCNREGCDYKTEEVIIPATGHNYDSDGYCQNCGRGTTYTLRVGSLTCTLTPGIPFTFTHNVGNYVSVSDGRTTYKPNGNYNVGYTSDVFVEIMENLSLNPEESGVYDGTLKLGGGRYRALIEEDAERGIYLTLKYLAGYTLNLVIMYPTEKSDNELRTFYPGESHLQFFPKNEYGVVSHDFFFVDASGNYYVTPQNVSTDLPFTQLDFTPTDFGNTINYWERPGWYEITVHENSTVDHMYLSIIPVYYPRIKCDGTIVGSDATFSYSPEGQIVVHDFTATNVSEETFRSNPTCAEGTTYYYSCTSCGAIDKEHYFEATNDAAGHNFVNNVCATCGTERGNTNKKEGISIADVVNAIHRDLGHTVSENTVHAEADMDDNGTVENADIKSIVDVVLYKNARLSDIKTMPTEQAMAYHTATSSAFSFLYDNQYGAHMHDRVSTRVAGFDGKYYMNGNFESEVTLYEANPFFMAIYPYKDPIVVNKIITYDDLTSEEKDEYATAQFYVEIDAYSSIADALYAECYDNYTISDETYRRLIAYNNGETYVKTAPIDWDYPYIRNYYFNQDVQEYHAEGTAYSVFIGAGSPIYPETSDYNNICIDDVTSYVRVKAPYACREVKLIDNAFQNKMTGVFQLEYLSSTERDVTCVETMGSTLTLKGDIQEGADCVFALMPQTFSQGLTIQFMKPDSTIYEGSMTESITLTSGQMLDVNINALKCNLKKHVEPYLTFKSKDAYTLAINFIGDAETSVPTSSLEYALSQDDDNDLDWHPYQDAAITFGGTNGSLLLRGNSGITYCYLTCAITPLSDQTAPSVVVSGDPRSLIDYKNISATTGDIDGLFRGCTSIVSAEGLIIGNKTKYSALFENCSNLVKGPSTLASALVQDCYVNMFYGCRSLTQAPVLPATQLAQYCYAQMFYDCSSLTQAPVLPATQLAHYCYKNMFQGCSNLTQVPALPATQLETGCYAQMFQGCTSLGGDVRVNLPAQKLANYCCYEMFKNCTGLVMVGSLPVDTLAEYCYAYMFDGCSNLQGIVGLPATQLAQYCYLSMFMNCTNLAAAPELPAKTMQTSCYMRMFKGCSALEKAPELPSTALAKYCYKEMFMNCTSLTARPELPATSLPTDCYKDMFSGCTSLPAE